jgi:hypothetical protein
VAEAGVTETTTPWALLELPLDEHPAIITPIIKTDKTNQQFRDRMKARETMNGSFP